MTGISSLTARQALQWLAVLEADQVSEEQMRDFQIWLEQDKSHQSAWEEALSFWAAMDQLPIEDIEEILAMADSSNHDATGLTHKPLDVSRPRPASSPSVSHGRGRRKLGLALAASLILAVGGWISHDPRFYADQYTRVGEHKSLVLADGSTVELNTDSAVSVEYSADKRKLILHHGEAYFSVAADPMRPFEVATAAGNIRALGTAFSIRSDGDSSRVAVYEHAVSIRLKDGRMLPSLEKGKGVAFSAQGFGPAEPFDLEREGAWRDGKLLVEERPLADVISELNRYRPGWIAILDSATEKLSVTGIIDTRVPDQALQNITESLPVSSHRLAGRWVFLYASSKKP